MNAAATIGLSWRQLRRSKQQPIINSCIDRAFRSLRTAELYTKHLDNAEQRDRAYRLGRLNLERAENWYSAAIHLTNHESYWPRFEEAFADIATKLKPRIE